MENLKEKKNVDLCMVISDVFCAEENTVYWNQLKRQENGDIILSCEKNYITAHKIVLVKASNYFNVSYMYIFTGCSSNLCFLVIDQHEG